MDDLMRRVFACLPTAFSWIFQAELVLFNARRKLQSDLEDEVYGGPKTNGQSAEATLRAQSLGLVNRCFHISHLPTSTALERIDHLVGIYNEMVTLLNTSVAISSSAPNYFQLAPPGDCEKIAKPGEVVGAYCYPGDWLYKDPSAHFIRVCSSSANKRDDDLCDALIHEMAHFVGPVGADAITDQGGHAYAEAALRLNHDRAMRSASCYAWLPWLARQGTSAWLTPVPSTTASGRQPGRPNRTFSPAHS
jgi:hypothetical protein